MPDSTKARISTRTLRAARRFYALPIDADTLAACSEVAGAAGGEDLVAAHLGRADVTSSTVAYTLAGFLVLEQKHPRVYLADLRDSGQVFCQQHSYEQPQLAFDSVAAFREFQAARDCGEGDGEDGQLAARFRPEQLESRGWRPLSTPALFASYRWLAAFLEPPYFHLAFPDQLAGGSACRYLRGIFTRRSDEVGAFHQERPHFKSDPHLAIYWLLHASILAEEELLAHVRDDLADSKRPLIRAFLDVFGQLGLHDDVPCAPGFRARRSSLSYCLGSWRDEPDVDRLATALRIDPDCDGFLKAVQLVAVAEGVGALDTVRAFARAHPGPQLGFLAVAALLDRHDGAASSPAADAVLRAWPGGERDEHLGQCLDYFQALASDRVRVRELVDRGLADDPYGWTLLHAARAAAERDGDSERAAGLAARIDEIAEVRPVVTALNAWDTGERAQGSAMFAELSPAQQLLVARRLLHLDDAREHALVAALPVLLASGDQEALRELHAVAGRVSRSYDLARTFVALRPDGLRGLHDPLVPAVLTLLRLPEERGAHDYFWKSDLVRSLAPIAHEAPIFDWLLEHIVADDLARLRQDVLMNLWSLERSIVPRLSDAQADRLLRTLARPLPGDDWAKYCVEMVWLDFGHPGGVPAIIELLDTTDDDELRDWMYIALASVDTPEAARLLWGRLFTDRRPRGALYNQIAERLDDSVHAEIMQALARTRDDFAACAYATVFLDFPRITRMRPHAGVASIAEEILRWPVPADPLDRGRRKYVLRQAARLAIESGVRDLARRAHRAAAAIRRRVHCDYHAHAHGRTKDPFTADPQAKRWLSAILAGRTAPRSRARRGDAIGDTDLERLAGVPIDRRFLIGAAGEVWFLDRAGRLWICDGATASLSPCHYYHAIRRLDRFLAQAVRCDEHVVQWDPPASELRDIARYGDRLLFVEREMIRPMPVIATSGIIAPDAGAAAALFKLLAEQPPAGWTTCGAWHVPGRGAVVRECTSMREATVTIRALADSDEARAAAEAHALACMRRPGVWISDVRVDRSPVDG